MSVWSGIKSFWKKVTGVFIVSESIKRKAGIDNKTMDINKTIYEKQDIWNQWYAGHVTTFHDRTYYTVDGTKQEKVKSLKLAKLACEYLTRMSFAEEVLLTATKKDENAKKVLNYFNDFVHEFKDNYESNVLATGGLVVKPIKDGNNIVFEYVNSDDFFPTSWKGKFITSGIFVQHIFKGNKHYVRLENHYYEGKRYIVENSMHEIDGDVVVKDVSLTDFYPDMLAKVDIGELKYPLFAYFKPAIANNIEKKSPLGISIFANATDILEETDDVYNEISIERDTLRARIFLPDTALRGSVDTASGRPLEQKFDKKQREYQMINYGNKDGSITTYAPELRVEKRIMEFNAQLNSFSSSIGLNVGTFTFSEQGVRTATEIIASKSETAVTKKLHESEIKRGFKQLVRAVMEFGEFYNLCKFQEDLEIELYFDDSVIQDEEKKRDEGLKLFQASAIDHYTYLTEYLKYSEIEANDIMQRIEARFSRSIPDFADDEEVTDEA